MENANKFTGKVIKMTDTETVGANNLLKRTILVKETKHTEDYKNNSIAIDFLGEKTDLLNSVSEGDDVSVYINYKAREAQNGSIYNGITGWKIEVSQSSSGGTDEDLPF